MKKSFLAQLNKSFFFGFMLLGNFFPSIYANNENIPIDTFKMTTEWLKIEPAKENAIGHYKEIIGVLKQNGIESLKLDCQKSNALAIIKALSLETGTGGFGALAQILPAEDTDHVVLYIKLNI